MKKIEINDKDLIMKFIEAYQISASELSFTNLYAWREKYDFHYIILNDFLWVINISKGRYYLSQPIGDYSDEKKLMSSIMAMKEFLHGEDFIIKKADDRFMSYLSKTSLSYVYQAIRADFDYLYNFEEMKTLSGNKFHKKKNHVNKFLKTYDWEYRILNHENLHDVEIVMNEWFKDKDDLNEKTAIHRVLDHIKDLAITGGVLYVDQKPVGFIIGEKLNEETMVIHFEKGINGYHGIYPMIFHEYIQALDYNYINREQDLGIPGLRKSKMSYHPEKLIKKYNVRFTWIQ